MRLVFLSNRLKRLIASDPGQSLDQVLYYLTVQSLADLRLYGTHLAYYVDLSDHECHKLDLDLVLTDLKRITEPLLLSLLRDPFSERSPHLYQYPGDVPLDASHCLLCDVLDPLADT